MDETHEFVADDSLPAHDPAVCIHCGGYPFDLLHWTLIAALSGHRAKDEQMTVAELVEKLQQFPADHQVFVDGYEEGIADAREPREIRVKLNVNNEWYYGSHVEIDSDDSYHRKTYGEPDGVGVYLPR